MKTALQELESLIIDIQGQPYLSMGQRRRNEQDKKGNKSLK